MILVHPWSKGREVEKQACWDALATLRETYLVIDVPCLSETDYEAALQLLWGVDDLILVEHDIAPTQAMILSLTTCPHPCCAQAYTLYPATTALDVPVLAHRKDSGYGLSWICEGAEFADRAGLGLTKISKAAQLQTPPQVWRTGRWFDVDTRVSEALAVEGFRFHIHWPQVAHHHK